MTNRYGYAGKILRCSKCGEVIIICHGELYKIVECTKKGHMVVERKPKEDLHLKTRVFSPHLVERMTQRKPSIVRGMTFSDIQRKR